MAKYAANYGPLTPITFLERTAALHPERTSIIYGDLRWTWAQTMERCRRLASRISQLVSVGQTVSVLSPNSPAVYEMNFGVPMARAVLNSINSRLDARTIAVLLNHSETKVLFVDSQYLQVVQEALRIWIESSPDAVKPEIIVIEDRLDAGRISFKTFLPGWGELVEYEELLQSGDPAFPIQWPLDDWETISLNYTSGTTSRPKGVLYHHRGAYLCPLITVQAWAMEDESVYLWTLPMFHCNGWCFVWGMAAVAGTNVIMRNVETKAIYDLIVKHKVTHLCGAPVVLNMIANAGPNERKPLPGRVSTFTGGAPPPPSVINSMEDQGFAVTHSYGLTETFGPALVCTWKAKEWDRLPAPERACIKARQGVAHMGLQGGDVLDPSTMQPVARDGKTIGEIMVRGSTVMKGYFRDEDATRKAFEGGWFHTGDLGVVHPDGYIEVKDRSKDIIISGGENISSIEIESVLFKHPDILEAAVVARPDKQWGESPCAFVTLQESAKGVTTADTLVAYCRNNLPRYYVPKTIVFCDLPKTSTGKVQKYKLRERAKALNQSISKL